MRSVCANIKASPAAMMLTGEVKVMGFTSPTWISLKNASATAARVSSAWAEGTAKQMECSLLA